MSSGGVTSIGSGGVCLRRRKRLPAMMMKRPNNVASCGLLMILLSVEPAYALTDERSLIECAFAIVDRTGVSVAPNVFA